MTRKTNSKTQQRKSKANQSLKGALQRTRRSGPPTITSPYMGGGMRKLTSRLSWPEGDCTTIHVRVSRSTASSSSTGAVAFALDPTNISTTGYSSLGAVSPLVLAMSAAYSRFMVTKCSVKATLVTPITNGGVSALGYTPDNSNVSGQPTSLGDAVGATHSDIAQVGETCEITFDASDYFVDWRPTKTSGATAPDNQCGVVQMWFDAGSSTAANAVYEVDAIIHFAGFRYNP